MTLDELLLIRDLLEVSTRPTREGEVNRRKALHYIYREIRLKTMDPRLPETKDGRLHST